MPYIKIPAKPNTFKKAIKRRRSHKTLRLSSLNAKNESITQAPNKVLAILSRDSKSMFQGK